MKLDKIVVASHNEHKIKEIRQIFGGAEIIPMRELGFTAEIDEDGETFRDNALIKAKAVSQALHAPALADDSGLCVDALDGAPGVYSARYSGKGDAGNRALLLKNLEGKQDRKAHFACAICLYLPDGTTVFGDGRTEGHILTEECGDNGFGYDPLFFSDDLRKSFGDATAEEKNSVSHRYRALIDLKSKL